MNAASHPPSVEIVCIDPLSNWGEGQGFTNKAQGQNRSTDTHTHTEDKYSQVAELRC